MDARLEQMLREAFLLGLRSSREGFNGEVLYDHLAPTESDRAGYDDAQWRDLVSQSSAIQKLWGPARLKLDEMVGDRQLLGRPVFDDAPNAWTDGTIPTPEVLPPPGVPVGAADVHTELGEVVRMTPAEIDHVLSELRKMMLKAEELVISHRVNARRSVKDGWENWTRTGKWRMTIDGYREPEEPK